MDEKGSVFSENSALQNCSLFSLLAAPVSCLGLGRHLRHSLRLSDSELVQHSQVALLPRLLAGCNRRPCRKRLQPLGLRRSGAQARVGAQPRPGT